MARLLQSVLAALAAASVARCGSADRLATITPAPLLPRRPPNSPIRTVITINSNAIDVAGDEEDVPWVEEKIREICAGPLASWYPELCDHATPHGEVHEITLWPPAGTTVLRTVTKTETLKTTVFLPLPAPASTPVPEPATSPKGSKSSTTERGTDTLPIPGVSPTPVSVSVPVSVSMPVPAPAKTSPAVSNSSAASALPSGLDTSDPVRASRTSSRPPPVDSLATSQSAAPGNTTQPSSPTMSPSYPVHWRSGRPESLTAISANEVTESASATVTWIPAEGSLVPGITTDPSKMATGNTGEKTRAAVESSVNILAETMRSGADVGAATSVETAASVELQTNSTVETQTSLRAAMGATHLPPVEHLASVERTTSIEIGTSGAVGTSTLMATQQPAPLVTMSPSSINSPSPATSTWDAASEASPPTGASSAEVSPTGLTTRRTANIIGGRPPWVQGLPTGGVTSQQSVTPRIPTTFVTRTRVSNSAQASESIAAQMPIDEELTGEQAAGEELPDDVTDESTDEAPLQCTWGPDDERGEGVGPCTVITDGDPTVIDQSTTISQTTQVVDNPMTVSSSMVETAIAITSGIGDALSPSWVTATAVFPTATASHIPGQHPLQTGTRPNSHPLAGARTRKPDFVKYATRTRQIPLALPDCTQTASVLLKTRDYRTKTIYTDTVTATSHIPCSCATLETPFIDREGIDFPWPRSTITATTPSTTTLMVCSSTAGVWVY